MKHCDKCGVDVESNLKNCPLCGAYLQNDDGQKEHSIHAYRELGATAKPKRIVLKILLFASIIASIVCLIVDMTANSKLIWSMHLVVAIVGLWLAILRPVFWRVPVRRQLILDMVIAILIVFYAEWMAKSTNNWGFLLGLPIILIATMCVYSLMMVIDFRRWRMYAMTVTPIAFLSMIPIFISLGVFGTINWAWYVTTGVALIMLASFFIFGKQEYIGELKKRLHF